MLNYDRSPFTARQAGLDSPGTLHNVMIQAIQGQPLFQEHKDRLNFLSRISKVSEGIGGEKTY